MSEANCTVVGGHSVRDARNQVRLRRYGSDRSSRVFTNAGALPGDPLILTKPIGTGVITTALKQGKAEPGWVSNAIKSMTILNRTASQIVMSATGVHAMTDITGFGLIGHGREMALGSGMVLEIHVDQVPRIDGAIEAIQLGAVPAGLLSNRQFAECLTADAPGAQIPEDWRTLLYDPQTAGGLLIAVEEDTADKLLKSLRDAGLKAARIGSVLEPYLPGPGSPAILLGPRPLKTDTMALLTETTMSNEHPAIVPETSDLYRMLPSAHDVLLTPKMQVILAIHSRHAVLDALRNVLQGIKQQIADRQLTHNSLALALASLDAAVSNELHTKNQFSLQRVVNATGVILHTNLGRAPLSSSALDHIRETAGGYTNLEMDLNTGERSRRDVHAEQLLLRLLRAKAGSGDKDEEPRAVVIVNNCAAATFLALNSIAEDSEVLVSRGELVEIGGGFRIPEILAKSRARLREVGTTNRTRVSDYAAAITQDSGLILRVHQSNFSIEGFTERPALPRTCRSRQTHEDSLVR